MPKGSNAWAGLVALALGCSCSCSEGEAPAVSSNQPAPAEAPSRVALPPGAWLSVTLREPQALSDLLREQDALRLVLPGKSWQASVLALSGIPLRALEEMDASGALRLLLVERAGRRHFGLAVPLRDATALIAAATAGDAAPFRKRTDLGVGLDRLERRQLLSGAPQLAVGRRYLVLVDDPALLAEFSVYLDAREPEGLEPVPAGLLAAGRIDLQARVRAWLLAVRERSPSLSPFLPKEELVASLPSNAPLLIQKTGAEIVTRVLLSNELGESEGLVMGPLAPLTDLPEDALLGLVIHESETRRVAAAERGASELLAGPPAAALAGPLSELARARAEVSLFGWERGAVGSVGYGYALLADSKKAAAALGLLQDAVAEEEVVAGFGKRGVRVDAGHVVLTRIGDVTSLRLSRALAAPEPLGHVDLRIDKERLWFGASLERVVGLTRILEANASRASSGQAGEAVLQALGPDAHAGGFLDAALFGPGQGRAIGRLYVALTRKEQRWELRACAPPAALAAWLELAALP